jgi:hypothetical protein
MGNRFSASITLALTLITGWHDIDCPLAFRIKVLREAIILVPVADGNRVWNVDALCFQGRFVAKAQESGLREWP